MAHRCPNACRHVAQPAEHTARNAIRHKAEPIGGCPSRCTNDVLEAACLPWFRIDGQVPTSTRTALSRPCRVMRVGCLARPGSAGSSVACRFEVIIGAMRMR